MHSIWREQRRKNRELKKQLEAAKAQNAVTDDGVDKDAEIETLKREVLEMQCRMKEESERYEVNTLKPALNSLSF